MKNIEGYIKWLGRVRAGQRKAAAVVLAFSIAVSGNVFWLMRTTGNAMSEEPVCGLEEHKHTDECYEKVLICDEDHEHTDECYETRLTCGLEEHTHGDKCYIDISSHEQKSDWEATIPELTGVPAEDIVKVAASQTGYEEGTDGYTRYGDWYGNPDGDWNVLFVSFCLNYAGIKEDTIPYGSGCWAWQVKLAENDLLVTDMSEMPKAGDILLTDNDKDGKSDRAGIIAEVTDDEITVIEGDVDGMVGTVTYKADDTVFGYVSLNAPVQEEIPAEVPEEPVEAETVTYDAVTASGVEVHAAAPAGAFPEGVTMSAADVTDKEVIAQAEEAAGKDLGDKEEVKGTLAVDITFTDSEGNEVEPAEGMSVDVNITIPESKQLDGKDYQLFHVNEDGVESVSDAVVSASEATFTSDGFSIYVVTATGDKDKDKINAYLIAAFPWDGSQQQLDPDNDGYISNSKDHPYYLRVGDTLILKGISNDGQVHTFNEFWGLDFSGIISIREISSKVDEVVIEITGLSSTAKANNSLFSPGEAALELSGTGETFSIKVVDDTENNIVVDFDQLPVYDPDHPKDTIRTVNLHYNDHVSLIGTPESDGEIPHLEDNPTTWQICDSSQMGWIYHGRTLVVDVCDYGGNGQVVTYKTASGLKKVRLTVGEEMIDHADIEIADGGVYTNVSFDVGDHGLVKTVTKYQSYVHGVNSCTLLDANDQRVTMYTRNSSQHNPYDGPIDTSKGHFLSGDYWHDSRYTPGMSQYELTSKYYRETDDGPYIFGNKRFYYSDVDHVRFDVELQIIPMEIETYVWDEVNKKWSGTPTSHVTYDITYSSTPNTPGTYVKHEAGQPDVTGNLTEITTVESSTVFNLDRRHVIDAYNKCPNHTGLDFTVHANHASVKFGATKELTNGRLLGGDFTFQLVDTSVTPNQVIEVKNASDGKIFFGNIEYEAVGIHTYEIREVAGDNPNIAYDDTVYSVTVTVTEETDPVSGTRFLMANVTEGTGNYSFKFINQNKFALPDTGGVGILPFMAGGVLLISSAVVLLMLRRRKEVDL